MVTTDGLRVRKSSSLSASVVGNLEKGDTVEILRRGVSKVTINGITRLLVQNTPLLQRVSKDRRELSLFLRFNSIDTWEIIPGAAIGRAKWYHENGVNDPATMQQAPK